MRVLETTTIRLPLPFRLGSVNCYLIATGAGFILIDTGLSFNRKALVRELESAGCRPGLLELIVLTHGDFDHSGNAAYLRNTFGGLIAMGAGDAGMVEAGDMFANRKKPHFIIRKLLPLFTGFGRAERFTPDVLLEDGDNLTGYGFGARVIAIPGHSKGSIGILAASAELFCGDLFENTDKPVLTSLVDDLAALNASFQRLSRMGIQTVYPGHGKPFSMQNWNADNADL
jgi:glyoxylase-like metal-dependent hydrolase (beta-lactamase superfamily II)